MGLYRLLLLALGMDHRFGEGHDAGRMRMRSPKKRKVTNERNGAVKILVCRQRSALISFAREQILKKYLIERTLLHIRILFWDQPDHQPDLENSSKRDRA